MEYLMLARAVSNAHTAIGFQLTWGSKSCSTRDPLEGRVCPASPGVCLGKSNLARNSVTPSRNRTQ